MLNIKGIGPKKIHTIWKEMEIESVGELLYACNENRLTLFKGFGEKTQQNVQEAIEFYLAEPGKFSLCTDWKKSSRRSIIILKNYFRLKKFVLPVPSEDRN